MVEANGNGITIEIGSVKPSLPTGVKMTDITLRVPEIEQPVRLDYLKAKAGLISLIKFDPEINISTGIFGGTIKGLVKVPGGDVKKMTVKDIKISGLNLETAAALAMDKIPGYSVKGRLDADGPLTE